MVVPLHLDSTLIVDLQQQMNFPSPMRLSGHQVNQRSDSEGVRGSIAMPSPKSDITDTGLHSYREAFKARDKFIDVYFHERDTNKPGYVVEVRKTYASSQLLSFRPMNRSRKERKRMGKQGE